MTGGGGLGGPSFAKYARFMRYLPYLGFPILMFFPSGMTLYWSVVSAIQLLITLISRSNFFKQLYGINGYLPNTILEKQYLQQKEVEQRHLNYVSSIENPKQKTEPVDLEPLKVENGTMKIKSESGENIEVFNSRPKKKSN